MIGCPSIKTTGAFYFYTYQPVKLLTYADGKNKKDGGGFYPYP
jgi:hypothetical protein